MVSLASSEPRTVPASSTTSVVVVAYHRPDSLARLLDALVAPDLEVVVVNVDADPDVHEVAGSRAGVILTNLANLGYGAAVNHGARLASSDVVVFTNDDVLLDAGTVRALAGHVRSGIADVAVPAVLDERGRVTPTIASLPTPWNLLLEWTLLPDEPRPAWSGRLRPQKWRRPSAVERVDAASAVTVAVRADLLAEVPMPEQYFLYWEESDWFFRLARRSARTVYDPGLSIVHCGGRHDVRPDKARLMAHNALRCVRDTQGIAAARRAWWIVLWWQLRLLVGDTLRWIGRPATVTRTQMSARCAGVVTAVRARALLR